MFTTEIPATEIPVSDANLIYIILILIIASLLVLMLTMCALLLLYRRYCIYHRFHSLCHYFHFVQTGESYFDSLPVGKGKGKEEYLYSAFVQHLVSDMDHTVLSANYTMPAFPS